MQKDDIALTYLKKQVEWLTRKIKELEKMQTKNTAKEAIEDADQCK